MSTISVFYLVEDQGTKNITAWEKEGSNCHCGYSEEDDCWRCTCDDELLVIPGDEMQSIKISGENVDSAKSTAVRKRKK